MSVQSPCCPVSRDAKSPLLVEGTIVASRSCAHFDSALILGGKTLLGTAQPQFPDDGEDPTRSIRVKSFYLGVTTVTNAEFKVFVEETGYITEAERFGWSFVFWSDVPPDTPNLRRLPGLDWWRAVDGADWRYINGPLTPPGIWKPDHPVVQVSWADACVYAKWAGGRLPTEAEWELSARSGLGDVKYPWGNEDPQDGGNFHCNI